MDWKIVAGFFVVIIGWFINGWLASKREFKNKQREVRINYLIEAYRSIASATNRFEATSDEHRRRIEAAIEDIQLLGNTAQLEALNRLLDRNDNNFNDIIASLRGGLREELKLPPVPHRIRFYRMSKN